MEDFHEQYPFKKEKDDEIFYKLALSIFVITLALFYCDLGPPLPPFYRWEKTADCHSIQFESFQNNKGFLNFTFHADETYELPREYLPNLINIEGYSNIVNVTYFGSHVTNRTQNGSTVNVIIPHQFRTSFNFTVKCMHNLELAKISDDISEVSNIIHGTSVSKNVGEKIELFENVCLNKDKKKFQLYFFSNIGGSHEGFFFGAENNLDFSFYEGKFHGFAEIRGLRVDISDNIVSPTFDNAQWQLILFDLPSILNSQTWSGFNSFNLLVPRVTKAASLVSPRVKEIPDLACFQSLTVAQFANNVSARGGDNNHIFRALETNFSSFRSRYVVNYVSKWNIAVSAEILTDEFKDAFLRDVCTNCNITAFDDDFAHLSDITNRAKVLIGNHVTNLAQTAMLNTGAHVIDCSPRRTSCNPWTKLLAAKFDVNYHSIWDIVDTNMCNCRNFGGCYPESPEKLNLEMVEKVRKLFSNILK